MLVRGEPAETKVSRCLVGTWVVGSITGRLWSKLTGRRSDDFSQTQKEILSLSGIHGMEYQQLPCLAAGGEWGIGVQREVEVARLSLEADSEVHLFQLCGGS